VRMRSALNRGVTDGARLSVAFVLALVLVLAGCQLVGGVAGSSVVSDQDVVAAAGWTRVATTDRYLVVINVLPGEQMFTAAEAAAQHPIEGELILAGVGNRVGLNVRHVEAHVYDRVSGMALLDVSPVIVVVNRTTGVRIEVPATLMEDVNIGASDVHYGNNVVIPGGSDLSLTVLIGQQEVTVDGRLA